MSDDFQRASTDAPNALPPGTRLGEFELRGVLGIGGFGIVYLAFDHALEREVAVKEYMPASMAGRTQTQHVSLRSPADADIFALGLRSFVNEARLLARFDDPSLIKVHRFWEDNGTAYMALPVLRGRTLKEIRQELSARHASVDERWLRTLLEPLLGALERLHAEGVYHRDIAPDNIQVEPDGRPVLLDFGAARRVIGDKTQTLTAILKPAYAPIEQYAEAGHVKQGPWTDLYALGATLHYMLLGVPPPPATTRAVSDEDHDLLSKRQIEGCSEAFLHIVDWMLAPRPSDRPASVAALREVLAGRAAPPQRRPASTVPPSQWQRTQHVARPAGPEATVSEPTTVERGGAAALPEGQRAGDAARARSTTPRRDVPPAAPPTAHGAYAPITTPEIRAEAGARLKPAAAGRGRLGPALLGVLVLAGAGATWMFGPWSGREVPAPDLAASVAAPSGAPAPASAALAGTEVAGVASAAASSPTGAFEVTGTAAAASAAVAAATAASAPAAPVSAAALPAGPVATVVAPKRPPPPARAAAPPPPAVDAAPRVDATLPAAPPRPATPEARCAGRPAAEQYACMERECFRPEFIRHPDCVQWQEKGAREREAPGN